MLLKSLWLAHMQQGKIGGGYRLEEGANAALERVAASRQVRRLDPIGPGWTWRMEVSRIGQAFYLGHTDQGWGGGWGGVVVVPGYDVL